MRNVAAGFIEAEGFVPIFDAVDAMVKATEVEVTGVVRLGGGIVAVAVRGDLATVEEAVDVGEEVARAKTGRSVKSIVFASPCEAVRALNAEPRLLGN
ncbi:BMC domain-containing protein [Actinomadura sp. 3N407]|uniref:BMC domain-containing protein n=1 Tax=Actinomadura sp. 3N407 TaxID=3457423 RepID=UPI003FCDFE9D